MVGKGKGADHRDEAQRPSTQNGCQNRCEIVLRRMEQSPGFALSSAVLASLWDATDTGLVSGGRFPLLPRNDRRLPSANPAGLCRLQTLDVKTSCVAALG